MGSFELSNLRPIDRILIVGALIFIIGFTIEYAFRKPQIGSSDEAFKTVDALFTAMTTKDQQRLDDCQQRLEQFREAGELNPGAAAHLDKLIQRAQSGDWDKSARELYDFMLAQRRR